MNKYSLLLLFAIIGFVACNNSEESDILSPSLVHNPATASSEGSDHTRAVILFKKKSHDFGTIVQGETVKVVYEFENTGGTDLIISGATGSCGCTVPTWPKRPIKPGKTGEIEVVFNSQGKKGKQTKKIYITANTTPSDNIVSLTGQVVAPE